MSHLIDMSNGRANMAYVGATPWHGLGSALEHGLTIDQWRQAAGLEYQVQRACAEYLTEYGRKQCDDVNVLFRSDTGDKLGVVSDRYRIVQPGEVLEFFRDLCADRGFALETAGALKGGAVYWGLAKTGHESDVTGRGDRSRGYLLLSSSADGSRATDARFTAIRVVCNNTLSVALSGNAGVRTKHSTEWSAAATKQALGLVDFDSAWNRFREQMAALCEIQVSATQATEYFSELLRPREDRPAPRKEIGATTLDQLLQAPVGGGVNLARTDKAPVDRAIRGLAELEECYYKAPGAVPGTAYGLVQGVTRYLDHSRGKDADKRLTSAWFGQGATLKQRAVEKALELA